MADKSLIIPSFKYGLDTRRENLVSLPGTLQTLQNAFINSGGEVEKRKAFVLIGTIPNTGIGNASVGFQDTDTGIMVFSEATNPGGLPTNIVWQQLTYPRGLATGVLNGLIYSCSFLGKAFVLATFNGTTATFAYYNGSSVKQITDGIVLTHSSGGIPETVTDLSIDLADIVNRITGWLADANVTSTGFSTVASVNYNETALAGSTLIMTPVGIHMSPVVENNNSVAGVVGAKLIDQNYPGVGAVAASTAFIFNAGTISTPRGTSNVFAPFPLPASSAVSITNGAQTYNTGNLADFAKQVRDAINAYTFVSGYTAVNNGTTVTVYAPTSYGAYVGTLRVDCTEDITTIPGTPGSVFSAKLTPTSNLDFTVTHLGQITSQLVTGTLTAVATGVASTSTGVNYIWKMLNPWSGSTPPPGFIWFVGSKDANVFGPIQSPIQGATCTFYANLAPGTSSIANFVLTADDGVNPSVDISFYVHLSFNV